ncbi:hypothetical protein AMTRI_Chr13g87340 [Amborella trichopoda]
MRRDLVESRISIEGLKRKKGWLRSLRVAASILKRNKERGSSSRSCNSENTFGSSNSANSIHQMHQSVRVRHCRKLCKEFTLFKGICEIYYEQNGCEIHYVWVT